MSLADDLLGASPKQSGDAIEAEVIQRLPPLEYVSDDTADWHDARTTGLLVAGEHVQMGGIVLVEAGTPIEIKAAQYRIGHSKGRTQRGRFYIKRRAHERLLEAAGAYLFTVYVPARVPDPICALLLIPASLVDELISTWTDVDGSRSEQQVTKLTWARVIDPDRVHLPGGVEP